MKLSKRQREFLGLANISGLNTDNLSRAVDHAAWHRTVEVLEREGLIQLKTNGSTFSATLTQAGKEELS
jgi:ABC-type metal ion transport system substrate-binding protein